MAYQALIKRFNVAPLQCINVLLYDDSRKYLLIANSVTSLNEFYILLYNAEKTNLTAIPLDGFALFQGGYYEPNIVLSNDISIYNPSAVNTLSGFIIV